MKTTYSSKLFIATVAACATMLCAGCGPAKPEQPTKEALKAKLASVDTMYSATGSRVSVEQDTLVTALGMPSSTQMIGKHFYWYYKCKDGTIQLELDQMMLSQAAMAIGAVNEF